MNPSRHLRSVVAYSVAALGLLSSSQAGTYVNDFTSSTLDRMTLNGGFRPAPNDTVPYPNIEGGHLAIVYADNSLQGTAVLDDLDPGKAIESFNMTFKVRIGGGSSTPADGMAVFLGNIDSAANYGEEGPADGVNGINGLSICWDIYDNGGGEAPAIDVKVNGVVVAHKAYDIFGIITDSAFVNASIVLTKNGHLTVTYKGQPVFTDIELPGYAPAAGDRFAFGARTGGLNANQWIDDLNIATVQSTAVGPTIGAQPASITVNERGTATFTVVANGSAPFTYQWLSNNVVIDGATSATYTIPSAPASANGAVYKVTVNNTTGPAVTSNDATLTVTPDTTKPTVASVAGNEALNAVIVTFSEPITSASLIAPGNYSLSGGLNITSIDAINDHTVRLNTSAQTAGTQYTLTLNGITDTAATPNTILAGTTVNVKAFVLSQGFLKFEYWNMPGSSTAVDELKNNPKYPDSPDLVGFVTALDSRTIFPDDSHETYGARISGFIIPKVSGQYRFFLSSDDASELSLSTDATTANLAVIATEPGCCNAFTEPGTTRTSDPIQLEANTPYAIQALVKEGGGGDYVQVAWRNELDAATIPASTLTPIPGSFLATYADPGAATVTFSTQPASVTGAENTRITFTSAATGSPAPLTFQWQRKGSGETTFSDIAGATGATYQTPILKQATDNGAVYRVLARVPGASVPSSEATLTVIIDSTKPQLIGATPGENQKAVTLTFSEGVDPTTATATSSYTISGLNVTAAALKNDTTVVLTTALQTAGTTYTVTAAGVKDSAGNLSDPAANSKQFVAVAIQRGVLKYEAYYGPGGTAVSDLTSSSKYPNSPDITLLLANFDSGSAAGDNYGARMSGFVIPSETGDYRFFLNSDDSSALWLSTDDSPANLSATPIAAETGCCNAFTEPENPRTSAPIHLEQNKMYYIVYIFKEGGGGDYGRVAWRLETDTTAAGDLAPIPGKNLAAALPPSQLNGFVLSGGTAPGTGTTPGFKARVYQVNEPGSNAPVNEYERAEQQLAGILGPNVADLTTSTGGIWTINDFINWNQEFNTGGDGTTEAGSFMSTSDPARPDQPIPGMPGTGAAAHNLDAIAGEVIGYVEFPAAGVYYLGVNSDDGFAVTGSDKPPVNNGALVVSAPSSVAGSYHTVMPGIDGTSFPKLSHPITGKLVYADPPNGCSALVNPAAVRGNIALIDRGVCTFAAKAQAAKDAGAIAVIIANNRDASSGEGTYPVNMGGGIDFPAFMISQPDGAKIKTAVGQDITISITPDTTPLLGVFNAGRGASDTIFPVIVPSAGVFPLRTVWFEGGGGANLEIFSVADTGEKILLNDTANPKALKSFVSRSSAGTPTISIGQSGANIVITFTGNLYAADKVDGPYTQIAGQGSVTVSPTGAAKFYKSGQ